LIGAAQNIKQQIAAQGQEIDQPSLMRQFILPHFDSAMKEIQESITEEFDVDIDELEEAVTVYVAEGDEELVDINNAIRKLYRTFGGDLDEDDDVEVTKAATATASSSSSSAAAAGGGGGAGGSLASLVELMAELADQMLQATDDYCGTFIDEHGIPASQPQLEQFQLGLMTVSQRVEKELLEETGMSEADLQSSLMANQDNKQIQEIFMQMQVANQQILVKHGIRVQ